MPVPVTQDDELTGTRQVMCAALCNSDALLRTLDLHSKVSVTDRSGRIIDVNDNFCRLLGYSREELLGQPHSMVGSGIHGPAFWASMWATIEAGQPWRGEICNRARDGSLHWVDSMIAPIPGADGSPIIYISIRNDITASKLMELKLRASEAFLDRTGQTAGVGGWEYDVATQDLHWSAQMMRIHEVGLDYQPVLAEGLSFYPPSARTVIESALRRAIDTGMGWDLELPLITARGRSIWVRTICEVEFHDGRPVRLLGSMQDTTARKQIESTLAEERAKLVSLVGQLQDANARFAIASESAGIAIWEFGATGRSVVWDERMYAIYGVDRATTTPGLDGWANALHPDDRARYLAEVGRAVGGDGHLDTEVRIVRPDGDIRHLKAMGRVVRATDGTLLRMTGVNIDVTQSKRAELQLFKTTSMLRTVLDSAAEISIIATDPDLTVRVFNVGAEHLVGYASADVVNLTTPALIHDPAELQQMCRRVSAELGRRVEGWEVFVQPSTLGIPHECTFRRADGRPVNIVQVVTAMRTYEGELLGYVSVGRDVTQQKQHEQSLREATQRAEQANNAKSAFLANMSHEIRTPMNAVIGLSYLLQRTALDVQQSTFLANIQTASKSLLAILTDVLDLSKIEAGELMVERVPFCPRELVSEVVDVMRIHADVKRIDFSVTMPEDLPGSLWGDPTRLKQILVNLLSNAVRFTDHGGVELQITRGTHCSAGIRLCFAVKDTGIGISTLAQSRLFTPFAQADASITRRYGGTGLGLSIVKSLVGLLDGELRLESTPGVGSQFTFELTFNHASPGPPARKPDEAAALGQKGLSGVRVLVVDDSDMNLEVVKYILEFEGAQVGLARNGQEAFDRLQAHAGDFDVVLMDVQMPGLDGHAATRLIRAELGLVDLPIIGLTAGALSSERDRAVAAGMDDFLIKPFDPAMLVRCIRSHFRLFSTRAATPFMTIAGRPATQSDWPEIAGIDSGDARVRLNGDQGLFLSSLARMLVEFVDLEIPAATPQQSALSRQAARMHKLKGCAGMLGANDIHRLASQAESACLAGELDLAVTLAGTLATHIDGVRSSASPLINSARSSADPVASAASTPLTPDLLAELVHSLRRQDLSALDRFQCLAPLLRKDLGDASYESVRCHIELLQFGAAAELLERWPGEGMVA